MFDARRSYRQLRSNPVRPKNLLGRAALVVLALSGVGLVGYALGHSAAPIFAQSPPGATVGLDFNTLRVHGYPAANHPTDAPHANRPSGAGSATQDDPLTGRIPEDAPYTEGEGPFDPLSGEAPRMDFVTWDPAWISERLNDPALRRMWPGLRGIDEVSAGSNIRIGGVGNASEKVWLRHWYEPQHLDKDLNADGRLTDTEGDGVPDAPVNPNPTAIDEWYPAIMTEFTYMLVDNDPLPQRNPAAADLFRSAPRPVCGTMGGTRMVLPVGISEAETDPAGPAQGHGLTSLDADFDGAIDMVNVTDEASLPGELNGLRIDFDGDNTLDVLDPDGTGLSCDEMLVAHTDSIQLERGDKAQFLDHFVELRSLTDSSASLAIYYSGDLVPRLVQVRSIGIGAAALAGDTGPVQLIAPGGTNLGTVPVGPWFVYVADVDPETGTALVMLGRGLGAPCAAMEVAPNVTNRTPGGPWFLKRTYVDGVEYNLVGIQTCGRQQFQYLTLRAPLPKVPVTIEQHSVRLQEWKKARGLALPPPFNHEHTKLEDIVALEHWEPVRVPDGDADGQVDRPQIHYMGGPMGPMPPVLAAGEPLPYTGRNPNAVVGPYESARATRWMWVDEDVDPAFLGQLREKFGSAAPGQTGLPPFGANGFFYNEQIHTLPWHYTEFVMPDQEDPAADPGTGEVAYDPDNYLVTTAWTNPTARWRRWGMPDGPLPGLIPPLPADLEVNATPDGGNPFGLPRRAGFEFDPDTEGKLFYDEEGVRVFGGQPQPEEFGCVPSRPRRSQLAGAGDLDAVDVGDATLPVEDAPYTDPFAPFNPQHPHAPRGDSLTFNPAYMDEFRNFNEELRRLYAQLSNNGQNAREKVYHRLWYEPEHVEKIRFADDCDRDLSYPAVMQEYTYLYVDMTDNPGAAPAGTSRFAFPIGTEADELPVPNTNGTLPAGGEFGHGLTTFDANFDGYPEAVTVQTEATLAAYMDAQWQSNRPIPPGPPPPVIPGPVLDFDGDGFLDDMDADNLPLTGDEMVVFAVESLTLDLDEDSPEGSSAMMLDHLVTLENVTRGSRAQLRFWFTGGNLVDARPEQVGGPRSLNIGDAALVDRFQDSVTLVRPNETNLGTDGAWFVFLESVATDDDRITVTVGRALGATHSAIDDGAGAHDLTPGDPWYLKRFHVDGHVYNVVALMTQRASDGSDLFQFITIRTPVPKGNFFNSQDSLFYQGYYLGGQPPAASVMPPFNTDHTIAEDIERIELDEFAQRLGLDSCVGDLRPADPLVETIVDEEIERRFGTELREIWSESDSGRLRWETDQLWVTPYQFTEFELPEDQQYLLTLNWTSPVSRLAFYGCTLSEPGPFPDGIPGINHDQLALLANGWAPPFNIIPASNRLSTGNIPYYDARIGASPVRVKMFYDPRDPNSPFINRRTVEVEVPTPMPGLAVAKRLTTPDPATVGDPVRFEIRLTNTGNTRLTDVDLRDLYATAYLDFVSGTPAPTSVDEGAGLIIWENMEGNAPGGTFDPGETIVVSVSFTATAATPDPARATNAVRATSQGNVAVGTAETSVEINAVPAPRLRVQKRLTTDNPTTIGSQVVFEILVTNAGNTVLTDVDVEDVYPPAFLDYVSALPAPTTVNEAVGQLRWDNVEAAAPGGSFDPGETIVLTVNFMAIAQTPDPDRARNAARATAQGGTVVGGPVLAEVEINPAPAPSVQVTKQLTTADPMLVGDTATFQIAVTNNGNTVLTDVDVADTFDTAYLDYLSATPAPTTVSEVAGTLTWDDLEDHAAGPTFDPGETIVITVDFVATAETPDPERAQNTVRVTANNGAVGDGPEDEEVEIDPRPTARLRITKQLQSPDPTTVGSTVVFRLTVTNVGDTVLTDVDVADTYETQYLDFLSASPAQTTVNDAAGNVTWNDIEGNAPGGSFDPGESIQITVNFTAVAVTPDPDRADNGATASAGGGQATAGPAVASVEIGAAPVPALRIQKRLLTPDPTTVGQTVRFEITVSNAGNMALTDVDVTDTYETEFFDFQSAVPVQTTAIDQPGGIITWNNVEVHASGGSFDPGDQVVLTVDFLAILVTQDPAKADNTVGVSAQGGAVTTNPAMASVEINAAASGAPIAAGCGPGPSALSLIVSWTDNSTFETHFDVEVSVNGSAFAPLSSVPTTSQGSTGTPYQFLTPNLVANASFQFRVRARNENTGETSPYSNTTGVCQTGNSPLVAGCVEGKVFQQGRSNHAGVILSVDGVPAGSTEANGSFEVCGIPQGQHMIEAAGVCALEARAQAVDIEGNKTELLADMALPGGDVNDDETVNLFDLVRIGADYRSQPPTDPEADCNTDGAVNLFDLVMVGSNYRKVGPVNWAGLGLAADPATDAEGLAEGSSAGPRALARTSHGPASAPPLGLEVQQQADGTIEVAVVAHDMERLYAADFQMGFDAERLKVVDALPREPGIQIQPGTAWAPTGFITLNRVDAEAATILFATTLLKPAEPLAGDVTLATITFEPKTDDPDGAFALTDVNLLDPTAMRIPVRWEGADLYPTLDRSDLTERVFLPMLSKNAE